MFHSFSRNPQHFWLIAEERVRSKLVFFTYRSTARVILGQVLNIVTYGNQTHTEVKACVKGQT